MGLSEFVRKVYKKKCYKSDHIPRIEGKESDEWMALDLGKNVLKSTFECEQNETGLAANHFFLAPVVIFIFIISELFHNCLCLQVI